MKTTLYIQKHYADCPKSVPMVGIPGCPILKLGTIIRQDGKTIFVKQVKIPRRYPKNTLLLYVTKWSQEGNVNIQIGDRDETSTLINYLKISKVFLDKQILTIVIGE